MERACSSDEGNEGRMYEYVSFMFCEVPQIKICNIRMCDI
jgi:hypothetical protein